MPICVLSNVSGSVRFLNVVVAGIDTYKNLPSKTVSHPMGLPALLFEVWMYAPPHNPDDEGSSSVFKPCWMILATCVICVERVEQVNSMRYMLSLPSHWTHLLKTDDDCYVR